MKDEQTTFELPKPKYTLFDTSRGDLPAIVVVNEALLSFTHTNIFPWHLSVEIEYHDVADNEMPTPEESDLINEIGDLVEEKVLIGQNEFGASNAFFLARSTWNRIRELSYRIHDPDVVHSALQDMIDSKKWPREWKYNMTHDCDWQQAGRLFKLFPIANGEDS